MLKLRFFREMLVDCRSEESDIETGSGDASKTAYIEEFEAVGGSEEQAKGVIVGSSQSMGGRHEVIGLSQRKILEDRETTAA